MPLHELGHAVTAWFCGFDAIPTLWKTLTPESRGFVAPLLLLAALGWIINRGRLVHSLPLMALGGALVLLQAFATFGFSSDTAQMLITWGGDGVGMLLATLLMGTFFVGKDTQLYKGWLRWGFTAIGAAAFVDMFATWWAARTDVGAIPYGMTGGMHTDSYKLVEYYGWSFDTLVGRYVTTGIVCLVGLAAIYAWGVLAATREAAERQRAQRLTRAVRHAREG